jgi:ribosomal protein L4
MALSEKYISDKMLEVERERLEVDKNTTKVLADIRDILMADAVVRLTELSTNPNVSPKNYENALNVIKDAKKEIEKRWSE